VLQLARRSKKCDDDDDDDVNDGRMRGVCFVSVSVHITEEICCQSYDISNKVLLIDEA